MTELVQCTRCRNFMIEEEYGDHLCRPRIRSYKVMKFTEFYIVKGENGKTILNIVTLDGDDLLLEEVKEDKEHTKIPYQPPNVNTEKTNTKHPPSEQIFIYAEKFVQISIIGNMALRLRSYSTL